MSRLAGVFEVLPSPALLVNLRSEVTDVNSAGLQFLGSQSQDLVQKDVLEALISEEDRADAGVYLKEALDGAAGDKSLKVTCIGRTGRKQVCLRAATTRSGGKLDGAIITLQDMSEIRNLAGATKTGGAEHLSGALHAIGTALFALDTEGKILEWTPKMEKITGYSSGQVSGQEMGKFLAENFKSAMKKSLEQALRGQEVSRFTLEINFAGNRPKEVWMSMAPWRSATGRIVGVMGHFDDVLESDRRVAEADWVREACAEQLDHANAFVLSVDSNMCVTEWNHRLADVTGKDKEAVAGKKLLDLVGSKQQVTDSVKAALQGEWSAPVQITVASLEMMVGFSPQLNFSGKVIGALAIGQPVAGQSPTQPPVQRDVKGMVLHELRSPLHGIIGLANTLSQDAGQLKKPLTMIGVSAERALELATNMMDFWTYQAEPVRQGPKDDMVDLGAMAREVVTKSKGLKDKGGRPLKKDKVNLRTEIQTVAVAADSSAMQQLLNQLLTNALKFTADGEVFLSIKEVDKSAVIEVSDTGSGIKPKIREGVLRAGSDGRDEQGIGLGLSMVKEVVRIHSGRCEIQAQEKGTLVTVTIPCQPPAKLEDKEKTPAPAVGNVSWKKVPSTKQKGPPSSWLGPAAQLGIQIVPGNAGANAGSRTATSLPSLKEGITTDQPSSIWEEEDNLIMSVDDDYVNQEVMRSILEPCGFKVIACMNGTECLEYLDGDNPKPRLLLLDLMMPGLSGFDVLQALHKKVSLMELPVVMVSAKNQSSSVVKGYELGCRDWIHKPFCRQELIARVKSHLKMRQMLLSYQLSAAQETSQENLPAVEEDEEKAGKSPMKEVLQVEVSQHVDGPTDTTALFATVDSEVAIESMASVFQAFESLSEQHQAFRTEIIGNSYLAIAVGTGDETRHTDKILLLAHKLRDTARKASMSLRVGIDTDTSVPAKPLGKRQYPKSSLFSATLQKAKQLSEAAADHRILLSRSARCRLSADVEAELQQRGLRLLSGNASSHLGEHYFIAATTESDPQPLAAPEAPPQASEKMLLESQMAVQALHQELLKSQNGFSVLQKQLSMAEEQMLQAKSEASALRSQLQVAKAAAAAGERETRETRETLGPSFEPKEKIPEISGSTQSTSLLFLQWQNAHLQAEIRHYQSALSSTKMELQMQIMAGQLLESKHNLLQARVEHLELDLGFKVACGSTMHAASPANSRPDSPAQPAPTDVRDEAPAISSLASLGGGLAVPGLLGSTLGFPYSHLSGPGASNLPMGMPSLQQMSFSQMPGMSGLNIGGLSGLQSGMPGMSGLGGAGMAAAPFGT